MRGPAPVRGELASLVVGICLAMLQIDAGNLGDSQSEVLRVWTDASGDSLGITQDILEVSA